MKSQPPKDGLVRAARPGLEVRDADGGDGMPKLTGYMLRFNEPTEIDSIFEGNFIERVMPGAATKTLKENRLMRILFNHGMDPHIGEKPLAEPRFSIDERGVRYDEPELFDTSYNRDLVPGLRSGQYGSSFKFRVVKEAINEEPEASKENPKALPERNIEEMKLYEGGPVVFPAYEGSSAGVRSVSLTDRLFVERAKENPGRIPELLELFSEWVKLDPERVRQILAECEVEEPASETSVSFEGVDVPGETSEDIEDRTETELAEEPQDALPESADDDSAETDEEVRQEDALPDGAEDSHSAEAGSREIGKYRTLEPAQPYWALGREE